LYVACLRSLDFQRSTIHQDEISPAIPDTFQWIWRKPELRFQHWLQHGNGTYWITGKPGSGKSTLMKYLSVDSRVIQHLGLHSPSEAITETFFFDHKASKATLANPLLGLLQSLLWQLSKQKASNTDSVYAKYEETKQHRCEVCWSRQELELALLAVLKRPNSLKDTELGTFLNGLSPSCSQNIRICIASRASFVYPFKTFPHIQMEEQSREDLRNFYTYPARSHAL